MAKKTTYEVVAIYDGKLDAADVFANLIYEKYQNNFLYQQQDAVRKEVNRIIDESEKRGKKPVRKKGK